MLKLITSEDRRVLTDLYPNYFDVRSKLDEILKPLNDQASTEGFGNDLISRMFISVADTFIGLANTFKTNVFKCAKRLKRSELREFTESNRMKVSAVDHLIYTKVAEADVDVPANLNGSYVKSVDSVNNVYTQLNALNIAKLTSASLTNIQKSILAKAKATSSLINSTALIIGKTVAAAREAVALCQRNFNGKFTEKKKFGEVFASMQEWATARNNLLNMESRLNEVAKITEEIDRIEQILKSIVSSIDADSTALTAKDVNDLADTAKGVALIFDSFAMSTTRQMALEHNYILIVNKLYQVAKGM